MKTEVIKENAGCSKNIQRHEDSIDGHVGNGKKSYVTYAGSIVIAALLAEASQVSLGRTKGFT